MDISLVSVITVVYNGAATLEATIRSVIDQTRSNVEFIIIDGGSSDGSLDIIKRYADKITYWISEPDKGIYDAMNKGIAASKADWLFFLGSDDVFYNDHVLSDIFGDALDKDYDFLYGDVVGNDYKGRYDGPFTFEKILIRNISHQAIFYKRSIFSKIGNFDLRYRLHADWDLNIRCFADREMRIKYTDTVIAKFGTGGVSAAHDIAFLRNALIEEKLKKLNDTGSAGLRALRAYDDWWRLLRNAAIRSEGDIKEYARGEKVPETIKSMVRWQRKIPLAILRVGIFSKSFMFASYLTNTLKGNI